MTTERIYGYVAQSSDKWVGLLVREGEDDPFWQSKPNAGHVGASQAIGTKAKALGFSLGWTTNYGTEFVRQVPSKERAP